jgi:hypothetical protein
MTLQAHRAREAVYRADVQTDVEFANHGGVPLPTTLVGRYAAAGRRYLQVDESFYWLAFRKLEALAAGAALVRKDVCS